MFSFLLPFLLLLLLLLSLYFTHYYRSQYELLKQIISQAEKEANEEVHVIAKQTKEEIQKTVAKKKQHEIIKHKEVNKTKLKIMEKKKKQEEEENNHEDKKQNEDNSKDDDNNSSNSSNNDNEKPDPENDKVIQSDNTNSNKSSNNNKNNPTNINDNNNDSNTSNKSNLRNLMNLTPCSSLDDVKLVSCAESCSGGLVSSFMCESMGASSWFGGGIVTYHLATKHKFLGVVVDQAHQVNCVSPSVAEEMARGVHKMFNTKWGLATTGYSDEYFNHKPIVYYCMYNSEENKAFHGEINWDGKMDRKEFILFASRKVYNIAHKLLELPEEPWIKPEK